MEFPRRGRPKGLYGVLSEGLLEDESPQSLYLASKDDRERAVTMGVEGYRTGKMITIRPTMSRADYSGLKFGSAPPVTGHEDMFFPFLVPGTSAWNSYMSTRKVVEMVDSLGRKTATVTSNMYEKLQELDSAAAVVKVFKLTQVLTDPAVHTKFSIAPESLRAIRAVAVVRPAEAANQAMALMRAARPDIQSMVTADGYSKSRRAAKQTIEEYCARFPRISATDECTVIGSDLFMYGPGNMREEWHVSGPLVHAHEVALVHRAVEACGASSVMFALGSEFVTLRIDIALRGSYLSPDMEYHLGDVVSELPTGSSPLTTALLSAEGKAQLERMRAAVVEVRKGDTLVASCVRVSDRYSIVGAHVLEEEGITVDGQELRAVRTVSPDLWLVEAVGPAAPVWALRDAREGERVVVCYRGPTGQLQYTSPMSVLTVGPLALTLSTTAELSKGMSGGAVVALEDLALLGVYEGAGRQQALALVFSPSMFADVHSVSGHTAESRVDGLGVLQKLRDRGLGSHVDSVLAAVQPLYSGSRHVGHAFGMAGRCYTACDPDATSLSLEPGGQPLVFSEYQGFLYVADGGRLPPAAVTRKPSYFEKVVVVGRDAEGPYYSSVTRVIHVGVNAANFSLEALDGDTDLPFVGGLVMSLVDGAVLGTRVRQSVSAGFGAVEFCVSVPRPQEKAGGQVGRWVDSIRASFPMLHPAAWASGLLEEVFKHSSVKVYSSPGKVFNEGMAPLAYIGDAALRVRFGQLARQAGLPAARWQTEVARIQSGASLAALATRLGFEGLVEFGEDTPRAGPGTRVYADVVQALVGAAKLSEVESVFEEFIDIVLLSLGSTVVVSLRSPREERSMSLGD